MRALIMIAAGIAIVVSLTWLVYIAFVNQHQLITLQQLFVWFWKPVTVLFIASVVLFFALTKDD